MIELLGVAMICATIVYVARLWAPKAPAEHGEGVAIRKELPPVPPDLIMQANKWQDEWAREQALKNMQELYSTTGNWDRVRYVYSQLYIQDDEN